MLKQLNIGFLFSILLLIVSEYFFLQEVYLQKRPLVIVLTALGIVAAAALFIISYRKFRKFTR